MLWAGIRCPVGTQDGGEWRKDERSQAGCPCHFASYVSAMGSGALGAVAEEVVCEDEEGHGFDHGDGAWEDAGVVAAAAFEGGVLVG
jgi:hypothetical protein